MATTGGGPSRRSHTKSRKGCKTCKRRHIRCDETFPQCRNCTKHQVKCDYRDHAPAEDQQSSPPLADLYWSSEVQNALACWQQAGECRVGNYRIDLHAQGHNYNSSDLRLIHQALWSVQSPAVNEFTVWTEKTPRFLEAAASQPFLVHALLAFGSQSLGWEKNPVEAKNLAYHHGLIALNGLQNAIGNFSRENADAVVASSILLSWQANDWRSWASLISGTRTVIDSMQAWKNESAFADIILEMDTIIPQVFPPFAQAPFSDDSRRHQSAIFTQIYDSIDHLSQFLYGREEDAQWIDQLKDYIQQLLAVRPAHSAEEQFLHLYDFRKWLFTLPSGLLSLESRDYMTLIVLAYYYSTALQLESIYPEVAPAFCSSMCFKPLQEIFAAFDQLINSTPLDQHIRTMLTLLAFPKQVAASYQTRRTSFRQLNLLAPQLSRPPFDRLHSQLAHTADSYKLVDHPSPVAFGTAGMARQWSDSSWSDIESPFLDVPHLTWDGSPVSVDGNEATFPINSNQSTFPVAVTLPTMSPTFTAAEFYDFSKSQLEFENEYISPQLWTS